MSERAEEIAYSKYMASKDFLWFTRYFFQRRFNKKFIVSQHHQTISDALMRVYTGETKRLIINIAPRYGKTELAVKNFIAYSLANNPSAKFIHLSYADDLALDNSEAIREIVKSAEYQELFNIEIKSNTDSKKKWHTTKDGGVYATSAGGQVTGFGAGSIESSGKFDGAIIIDDPIKPDDADSDRVRDYINNKFDSTIKNRVNSRDTPIIIIMQRLHESDLCGYVLGNDDREWEVVKMPCIYEIEGQEMALWPQKHSLEELYNLRKSNEIVFDRQYMQNPKPLKGLMYSGLKTCEAPPEGEAVMYCDTADTGADYLCAIVAIKNNNSLYITDVVYTQEPQEVTESLVANLIVRNKVNRAVIESNNGGRSFARSIQRILEDVKWRKTNISTFHQSANKNTRILSNSSTIVLNVYFCNNLNSKFMLDLRTYSREGKNAHDDAPDALTGLTEHFITQDDGFYF